MESNQPITHRAAYIISAILLIFSAVTPKLQVEARNIFEFGVDEEIYFDGLPPADADGFREYRIAMRYRYALNQTASLQNRSWRRVSERDSIMTSKILIVGYTETVDESATVFDQNQYVRYFFKGYNPATGQWYREANGHRHNPADISYVSIFSNSYLWGIVDSNRGEKVIENGSPSVQEGHMNFFYFINNGQFAQHYQNDVVCASPQQYIMSNIPIFPDEATALEWASRTHNNQATWDLENDLLNKKPLDMGEGNESNILYYPYGLWCEIRNYEFYENGVVNYGTGKLYIEWDGSSLVNYNNERYKVQIATRITNPVLYYERWLFGWQNVEEKYEQKTYPTEGLLQLGVVDYRTHYATYSMEEIVKDTGLQGAIDFRMAFLNTINKRNEINTFDQEIYIRTYDTLTNTYSKWAIIRRYGEDFVFDNQHIHDGYENEDGSISIYEDPKDPRNPFNNPNYPNIGGNGESWSGGLLGIFEEARKFTGAVPDFLDSVIKWLPDEVTYLFSGSIVIIIVLRIFGR
ncbi:MAG: hypothetical protein LBC96_04560 [Lachnospiraceae bacterium]|jgi:hypothetical protein|nr:hypothetical protein [Lachnospiraceae bacterium]